MITVWFSLMYVHGGDILVISATRHGAMDTELKEVSRWKNMAVSSAKHVSKDPFGEFKKVGGTS